MRIVGALAVSLLGACDCERPAPATWPKPKLAGYVFRIGETLKLHVESGLTVDMTGTDPLFLTEGNTRPLSWNVEGDFENAVLEVDNNGGALIERRVREIKSSGHWNAERFGLAWNRDKDTSVPDLEKLKSELDQYVARMILSPLSGRVDIRGYTIMSTPGSNRFVVRQGMMYWPLRLEEKPWTSREEMAVPILHDKLTLTFANSIPEKTGNLLRIVAPVSFTGDSRHPAFAVSGGAKAEFDFTTGRLKNLEIDLRIEFSGQGDLPGGRQGDLRGVVSYRETQRLVQ